MWILKSYQISKSSMDFLLVMEKTWGWCGQMNLWLDFTTILKTVK